VGVKILLEKVDGVVESGVEYFATSVRTLKTKLLCRLKTSGYWLVYSTEQHKAVY